jgi:hypothetical protein
MTASLRLSDLPALILRRNAPFESVTYVPEWCFWFFVFEHAGFDQMIPIAENSGRFFVRNFPAITPPPAAYQKIYGTYKSAWWASLKPRTEDHGRSWDAVDVMQELEEATVYLKKEIVPRRRGKSGLILSMAGAGKNAPRIEFDVGTVPIVFGLNPYHPAPDRLFNQQTFFGFWGAGQIHFWSVHEIKPKLKSIMEFYNVFLPIFSAAS